MVGDEIFFSSIRRFYRTHTFQSAGTDDLQRAFEAESGRSFERFFERWIYGAEIPQVVDRSSVINGRAVVRLEQRGDRIFDLPVTATLVHEDGTTSEAVVVMTHKRLEQTIESAKRVRQLQLNRDSGTLAEFER
jgi:aminopeptidase N